MNELSENASKPTPKQQRKWFRYWILSLIALFVVTGGSSMWFEWKTKRGQNERHDRLMDPILPDPGVTTAATSSTDHATPVYVGIYMERIPELSVRNATWTAVMDVWFRWEGDDLHPGEGFVVMAGSIQSRDKLASFEENGTHYERYRVEVKITKIFTIPRFPLDSHILILAIENGETVREKMLFVPDLESTSISSRLSVPGYQIRDWKTIEKAHSYRTTRGDPRLPPNTKSTYSQYRLGITIERGQWGLYFKMFQALYIAVIIAIVAFFIKPTDVDPRFGLGVGALFAAVANSYLVSGFVPDTGELTLADIANALGILTILVTLIESTLSLYIYDILGNEELSHRLDRASFKVVTVGFMIVSVSLYIIAM